MDRCGNSEPTSVEGLLRDLANTQSPHKFAELWYSEVKPLCSTFTPQQLTQLFNLCQTWKDLESYECMTVILDSPHTPESILRRVIYDDIPSVDYHMLRMALAHPNLSVDLLVEVWKSRGDLPTYNKSLTRFRELVISTAFVNNDKLPHEILEEIVFTAVKSFCNNDGKGLEAVLDKASLNPQFDYNMANELLKGAFWTVDFFHFSWVLFNIIQRRKLLSFEEVFEIYLEKKNQEEKAYYENFMLFANFRLTKASELQGRLPSILNSYYPNKDLDFAEIPIAILPGVLGWDTKHYNDSSFEWIE